LLEERALLNLLHGIGDLALLRVGLLCGLAEELEAARIGTNDAETALGLAVLFVQGLERGLSLKTKRLTDRPPRACSARQAATVVLDVLQLRRPSVE
jgi:hypothetical protein